MAKKELTFEQAMDRLEVIVQELEKNEKPLDETVDLFEEGLNLVKTCNARLSSFETKIEELSGKKETEDDGEGN
ncbi:MAG: exodeoxyribonuclease VII small subunit [Erysipelotrichaceae bacterium]|uniref:exodeoxyribonuclease VII small subunit n=1 Tax=Galactobacillus timonensis TaxID=2041840 RepID=UPI000C82681D|nr:exodeoxyribonuclease VII small subunit [Galactobacillus timonensis]MDY6281474.1 exodeoxyribonuclease VII small subunit [Erysipelotrichaceae bacterium]